MVLFEHIYTQLPLRCGNKLLKVNSQPKTRSFSQHASTLNKVYDYRSHIDANVRLRNFYICIWADTRYDTYRYIITLKHLEKTTSIVSQKLCAKVGYKI